uniref:G-protein coupled receptors family 1 profile domain-containing protein n=1 Tax=Amazona collaria TaxID=241587 RepID=A0A8B9FMT1_9PSIT
MTPINHTDVHEFVLLGLTICPDLQVPLFMAFLAMYLVTLLGNFGITVLIRTDLHLHTPMCYFLSHFAFVDICYSSIILPKMLDAAFDVGASHQLLGVCSPALLVRYFWGY